MQRATHTIDASKRTLGRLATEVAKLLMGKHKPAYVPYKDEGDMVLITNAKALVFTGNKMNQKLYYRPTTRVGALKSESLAHLWERRPEEVIRKAVYGMLPKNSLRKEMIKRLKIQL